MQKSKKADDTNRLNRLVLSTLAAIVRAGGAVIEDQDWIGARRKACMSCEFSGTVKPLGLVEADGCTLCGCPIEEKIRTLTKLNARLEYEKETCPHPEADQWQDIDKRFSKQ